MKAVWNGAVVAESDDTVVVEGNHYFPAASVNWDLFQPSVRFRIADGALFICGNEVAWLLENHFQRDGAAAVALSIETYRFGSDGSVVIRTYYKVPRHDDGQLGELFRTYLP